MLTYLSQRKSSCRWTVSGTSITFGTPSFYIFVHLVRIWGVHLTRNNKVVIVYRDRDDSNKGKGKTVSGTSISFGSVANFSNTGTVLAKAVYDSNAERIVVVFQDSVMVIMEKPV